MDFLIWFIGVIIISVAALLTFTAGMRNGIHRVRMEYKDHVSPDELSDYISIGELTIPGQERMRDWEKIVRNWDKHRSPDRHKFKPVHID